MKIKIAKLLFILGAVGLVQGCEKKTDLAYLLTHPTLTKVEATNCLDKHIRSAYCDTVLTADSKLMGVYSNLQNDPEAFGQQIIDLEMEYGQTTPPNKSLAMEIQMMLAVVGLNSPE